MQVKNTEHGIRKTLEAVFKEKGLSAAASKAKVEKNLKGATSEFFKAQQKSLGRTAAQARLGANEDRTRLDAALKKLKEARAASAPKKKPFKPKNKGKSLGASIKSSTQKVTSAEQVALRKTKAAPTTQAFLAAKTGASVAIALGAVAKWARKLA